MNPALLLASPVALALALIILAVSLWGFFREEFRDKHTLIPYDMIVYKEYWRIITSGLIHGNWFHLTLNLITFYFFAFLLEQRLGHWQFGLFFLLALILSNVAVTLIYRNDSAYEGSVGASGAISGIVLGAVLCYPYLEFGLPYLSNVWPWLRLPAMLVAGAYLIYTLVQALRKHEDRINHHAHLWGAIAGIALTFLIKPSVFYTLSTFFRSL